MHGVEGSEKDKFCGMMSEHYNIPIITMRDIFEYVEQKCRDEVLLADFEEERDNIRSILEEERYVNECDIES